MMTGSVGAAVAMKALMQQNSKSGMRIATPTSDRVGDKELYTPNRNSHISRRVSDTIAEGSAQWRAGCT